ncbi:FadR/GntR family transcriptional regulator [Tessaracoccus lacteus]|uniref:GntR family transcriptional regulator n=1 Tax=Tessaracoccus lacteus TaxID=3041766 RepID=A0ABY8Q1D3_9ACTN|nr:FCD domain-containing protein [Tessaracoccus sp. T21]WGT48371.1 GntR family transcriptional regulator [Tessaracoccus sp. T21]
MTVSVGGFESALDYLTGEILEGNVAPGERLPNERELASQLGASRSAVREAIKVLQAQGVVTSQTGPRGGTRVATGQGVALARVLRLHVALGAISFDEVTSTRVVLERAAAEAAAHSIDDDGVRLLQEIVAEMQSTEGVEEFNELDTRFHVTIALLGANRLVRDLTIAIREAVEARILEGERESDWEPLRTRLNEEHAGILEALRMRDGRLATERCEAHIRGAHRAIFG